MHGSGRGERARHDVGGEDLKRSDGMSKWRVHLRLLVGSAANGSALLTSMQGDIAGRDIYDTPTGLRTGTDEGGRTVSAEARFNTQADADAFYASTQTRLRNEAQILAGSKISKHLCHHDSGVEDCFLSSYIEEIK